MPEAAKRVYRDIIVLFSASFAFLMGILPVMLLSKGLDVAQLGLYFAIYSFSVFFLEVPTGAFADVYGRKNAILIAFLMETIFMSGFLIFDKGPVFAVFAVFAALADSFFSGSAEAHAVDILKERKKSRYLHQLLASGKVYMFGTFLIGSAVGGYLATIDYSIPVLLCLAFAVIGSFYSFFKLREVKAKGSFAKAERSLVKKMKEAFRKSSRKLAVRMVYVIAVLFGIGTLGLFMLWQPAFVDLQGWDTSNLGFYFTLVSVCAIAGAKLSGRFRASRMTYGISLLLLWLLLALSGIFYLPLWAPVLVLAWQVVLGFVQPMENTILNRNTSSEVRATVISIKGLAYRFGFGLAGITLYMIGSFAIGQVWIATSFAFLVAAMVAFLSKARGNL